MPKCDKFVAFILAALYVPSLMALRIDIGEVKSGQHLQADGNHFGPPSQPATRPCSAEELFWVPDKDGVRAHLTAQPKSACSFHRFSVDEAAALLSHSHLLFLGESVMNYQYLALAYWLHARNPLQSWDAKRNGMQHPLAEQWWANDTTQNFKLWNQYYNSTSALFDGNEVCDCYRDNCHPTCVPQTYFGNRYFRFGNSAYGNTSYLSFVPALGNDIRPRGHSFDRLEWNLGCRGLTCNAAPDWDYKDEPCYLDVVDNVVKEQEPDILVMAVDNHWLTKKVDAEVALCGLNSSEFEAASTKLFQSRGSKPIMIYTRKNVKAHSHTPQSPCAPPSESESAPPLDFRCLTWKLNDPALGLGRKEELWVDSVHPAPWVYFELNQMLLNVVKSRLKWRSLN